MLKHSERHCTSKTRSMDRASYQREREREREREGEGEGGGGKK